MEFSRPKEERKTKEHITPGNGDRHEKNEQELDGTRKEGGGQGGLENASRWPMLHWDPLISSVKPKLNLINICHWNIELIVLLLI
ncbi:unnamed protein product [Schistosoma margrebowiei]|uniref:Uncharacterized protein n=1 Tax=Schistosoma margrebowiei TaxID=48269 RepID=A0A183LIS7_9TREM|nr:unnamed protein product [Schistosoma margrebowiei]